MGLNFSFSANRVAFRLLSISAYAPKLHVLYMLSKRKVDIQFCFCFTSPSLGTLRTGLFFWVQLDANRIASISSIKNLTNEIIVSITKDHYYSTN